MNEKELEEIINVLKNKDTLPIFTVGFNRRYAPMSLFVKEQLKNRANPVMINYRVNDEYIPNSH
jgi:polar amino acid transport system substrate-binding protein